MRRRAFAGFLALVLVAVGLPAAAYRQPGPSRTPVAWQQEAPVIPGIEGRDACGLLTDDVLLRATGAAMVTSRVPNTNGFMAASCDFNLAIADDPASEITVMVGVEPTGGRRFFDLAAEDQPIVAGIGDAAIADGSGSWTAVKGDTLVLLTYIGFGGAHSERVAARALIWRIMRDLPKATTAVGPSPAPVASMAPMTAARALVGRLRAPDFGEDALDATIEILARSGVGTYASPDDVAPVMPVEGVESPVRLLREQVRAMALEAWGSGGLLGADLDPLAEDAPDLVPASWVVAAYVVGGDTEGAEVARSLMGDPDVSRASSVVVPQLVLTLFVSDLARERMLEAGVATAAAGAGVVALAAHVRTAQGDLCSVAADFVNSTLTRVFDALRLDAGGGGGLFSTIWNVVVSVVESAARAIISAFSDTVLAFITHVAAVVGMVVNAVSFIRPWSVALTVSPPVTVKGINGSLGQAGEIVARVDLGGYDDWPPLLKACAAAIGRPLPNLKPEGAPVVWETLAQEPGGLVAPGTQDDRLDPQGVARWRFTTLVDTVPEPWTLEAGVITTSVIIRRPQLDMLRSIAVEELLGGLPGVVRDVLRPWVRDALDKVSGTLDDLVSRQALGAGTVLFHVPDEPEPPPEPGQPPAPAGASRAVWVHLDREAIGSGVEAGRVLELYSCSGPYGFWVGDMRVGGLGAGLIPWVELPVAFTFDGASGIRITQTDTEGTIPWNLRGDGQPSGVTSHVEYLLIIEVGPGGPTGYQMRIRSIGSADERVQGQQLLGEITESVETTLPIEPAPPGSC